MAVIFHARRILASTLTVGTLATGIAVLSAPAAYAASKVSYCFVWENGKPYAAQPVALMQLLDGKKTKLRTDVSGADGCGAFRDTPTAGELWVRARAVTDEPPSYRYWWAGRTPETAERGKGHADLGTGKVRVVRAIG